MNNAQIESFVTDKKRKNKMIRIHFKHRPAINGLFVFVNDYTEMKEKNFWRVVSEQSAKEWSRRKDNNNSRLFSGSEFTKLADV